MPSPFPGMDPYLEAPDIWPDFHDALASEIRTDLNLGLPAPYYARLEMRPEVGIVEEPEGRRRIVPDVAVVRRSRARAEVGGVALLERPRREVSPSVEITIPNDPIRHHFVEIRDPTRGHKLVTLIEILSPSNKAHGPDRDAYLARQRELLASDASLIEIDLLRGGLRALADPALAAAVAVAGLTPPPAYLVLVNRAWTRAMPGMGYQVFPADLREWLPCFPVPLKQGEAEVPLDLQFVVNRAYDGGPYLRGAVDYSGPPAPPLSPDDAAWAVERVRARGLLGD